MSKISLVAGETPVVVELGRSAASGAQSATLSVGEDTTQLTFRTVPGPRGALAIEVDGRRHLLWTARTEEGGRGARHVAVQGRITRLDEPAPARRRGGAAHDAGDLSSPMPGTVLEVRVRAGDSVTKGAVLVVIEAMKMEHSVSAPRDGTVSAVHVAPGDRTTPGQALVDLD